MRDLHMHTVFSDGNDTAEEMILSAIEKGLDTVGISDHSYTGTDDGSMTRESTEEYRAEMARLKEKYRDRITVLCGLERDYWSDDFAEYDYVIGSVHSLLMPDGHHVCVDWTPERLEKWVEQYFAGDWYALAEAYYALEADVVRKTKCDIIGHFDLLTKFNEKGQYFDENHPRYTAAWKKAADTLLKTGKPFEVNTGAITRGWRTTPYPAEPIRKYLKEHGAVLIPASDSHFREHIAYGFDKLECTDK